MTLTDPKSDLHRYLQEAREALLWKLDGLSEYDIRRPMVRTGTNLLGIIKHVALVELGYFGDTFERPSPDQMPWDPDDPNSDMFATPGESREFITGLYRRAWAHSDATIEALPLDATGHLPWWPAESNEVTLNHILVRVTAETSRTRGTPTSSENSSTAPRASRPAIPTWPPTTGPGGRPTATGSSAQPGEPRTIPAWSDCLRYPAAASERVKGSWISKTCWSICEKSSTSLIQTSRPGT